MLTAKTRPVIVETYIVPSTNKGEDALGPTSLTHKSEGLPGMLEADTPVRIALPRNIFHESLSDTPNVCFPINNLNSRYRKKNLYISYLLAGLFCGDYQVGISSARTSYLLAGLFCGDYQEVRKF
jgi:hypothetical protein